MMSLFLADVFKIRTRAIGWIMLGITILLVTVIMITMGLVDAESGLLAFPLAFSFGAEIFNNLGGFLLVIFGAALVGSEYGYDTWKNILTRHPSRVAFMVSKWLVLLLAVIVALIVIPLWSQLVGLMLSIIRGVPVVDDSLEISSTFARIGVQAIGPLVAGGIGLLGATIGRSTVAGIIAGIFWLIADSILGGFIGELLQVLTFSAHNAALVAHSQGLSAQIGLATNLIGIGVYLFLPVTVAALLFRWRDMAGH